MDEVKCATCEHSIYDSVWGEYKCRIFERVVRSDEPDACPYYNSKQKNKKLKE